ncbi:hypothetical protein BC828DRAFT_382853 [Blastocladiella britannica]|nr:hypothetical protein BC828DRAFT_382853 [Blastocladiella britannica]
MGSPPREPQIRGWKRCRCNERPPARLCVRCQRAKCHRRRGVPDRQGHDPFSCRAIHVVTIHWHWSHKRTHGVQPPRNGSKVPVLHHQRADRRQRLLGVLHMAAPPLVRRQPLGVHPAVGVAGAAIHRVHLVREGGTVGPNPVENAHLAVHERIVVHVLAPRHLYGGVCLGSNP